MPDRDATAPEVEAVARVLRDDAVLPSRERAARIIERLDEVRAAGRAEDDSEIWREPPPSGEGWVKLEDVVAFLRSRYLTTTANAVLAEFGPRGGAFTLRAGSTVTHAGWEGVRIELEEPFTAEGDTVVVFDVDLKAGTARVRPVGPREGTDGE